MTKYDRDNNCEVGYFALIDTSKEMTEDIRDVKAEISNTLRLGWIKEDNRQQKINPVTSNKKKKLQPSSRVASNTGMKQGPFGTKVF